MRQYTKDNRCTKCKLTKKLQTNMMKKMVIIIYRLYAGYLQLYT
jgi:hypothetical protein